MLHIKEGSYVMEVSILIPSIIYAVIGGLVCRAMSKSQGRNVLVWTVAGIGFSIFAILFLYWKGDTEEVTLRKAKERIRN